MMRWPFSPLLMNDKPRTTPITNPEMLQKIDLAYSRVCSKCSTVSTCLMVQDRHICEGRPLLECSIVKREML